MVEAKETDDEQPAVGGIPSSNVGADAATVLAVERVLEKPQRPWEDCDGWRDLHGNPLAGTDKMASNAPYLWEDPSTGKTFIIKTRDLQEHFTFFDSRKMAIFEEVARYYGVKTPEEVVVNPTTELFSSMHKGNENKASSEFDKNKARALRIAEVVPAFNPEAIETWFPSAIYDHTSAAESGAIASFNPEKFKNWFASLDPNSQAKTRASLEPLHQMVTDGFLMDLFGDNCAFKDGEFVLLDVEPIQLADRPFGKVIKQSEDVLNAIFRAVGLPEIHYEQIIKTNYGEDKFLRFEQVKDGGYWHTNVKAAEELALYRKRLEQQIESKGELPRNPVLPPQAIQAHQQAINAPDELFKAENYDWTKQMWEERLRT